MDRVVVDTALGRVPVWLRGPAAGPLVVAVRGAFPDSVDDFEWLDAAGARFAFLHLPGFHSPFLTSTSVDGFIAAFDETLERVFPGETFVAAGLSVGALVAMGLARARAVLAVEPFLRTGHLWPLFELLRALPPGEPGAGWAAAVFGLPPEGRDYRRLLDRPKGAVEVVVGDIPLVPRRRVVGLPSLCDEQDRSMLAAHPGVRMNFGQGGHAVHRRSQALIQDALARLLRPCEPRGAAHGEPDGGLG